jgi:hypothetical protein
MNFDPSVHQIQELSLVYRSELKRQCEFFAIDNNAQIFLVQGHLAIWE